MLTDRDNVFLLDHPLLTHFYSAQAILFSDHLDEMKYYYTSSILAQEADLTPLYVGQKVTLALPNGETAVYTIVNKNEDSVSLDRDIPNVGNTLNLIFPSEDNVLDLIAQIEYRYFYNNPHLFSTRMVNLLFATLACFILFYIIFHLTKSITLSIFVSILYLSFPTLFIYSSSGSRTAITIFSVLIVLYFYTILFQYQAEDNHQNDMGLFIASLFLALSDHKAIILPIAIVLCELWRRWGRERIKTIFAHKAVLGFVLGTAIFWIYGMWINIETFLTDHFRTHFLNRFLFYWWPSLSKLLFSHSEDYPSRIELWYKFAQELNPFFFFLALISSIWLLLRSFKARNKDTIFVFLSLIGAISFSIVDWRQTKHLMLIIPSLVITVSIFIAKQKRMVRLMLMSILMCVAFSNIWMILKLTKDFSIIQLCTKTW